MTQAQIQGKPHSSTRVSSVEELPIEIIQLLQVLARIEARRQAKLRAEQKAREHAPCPT
jgi:hypothetical protein